MNETLKQFELYRSLILGFYKKRDHQQVVSFESKIKFTVLTFYSVVSYATPSNTTITRVPSAK